MEEPPARMHSRLRSLCERDGPSCDRNVRCADYNLSREKNMLPPLPTGEATDAKGLRSSFREKRQRTMQSMEYYETLRQVREELLRQAEQERLAHRALVRRPWRKFFHLEPSRWLSLKQE